MRRVAIKTFSTAICAILAFVPVHGQDGTRGPSLFKTGFLGLGVEPGLCSKWPLLETPSVIKELKLTKKQLAALRQAKVESSRISKQVGLEKRQLRDALTAQRRSGGSRRVRSIFAQSPLLVNARARPTAPGRSRS